MDCVKEKEAESLTASFSLLNTQYPILISRARGTGWPGISEKCPGLRSLVYEMDPKSRENDIPYPCCDYGRQDSRFS